MFSPEGCLVQDSSIYRRHCRRSAAATPVLPRSKYADMAPATSILAGDAAASRRQNFESVFPTVRDELVQYVKDRGIPQDAVDWFAKVSTQRNFMTYLTCV